MSDSDFSGSAPLATPAQVKFYRSLLAENVQLIQSGAKWAELNDSDRALMEDMFRDMDRDADQIEKAVISGRIDQFKAANAKLRAERPRRQTTPDPIQFGVYLVAGKVIRVYPGRQSGRMLAAEITEDGPKYLGAAFRFVKPSQRLSLEDAAKYGAQFGICCVCAAPLTDPVSVAAGIGPICSGRYNG